jgi:hypothetical protein
VLHRTHTILHMAPRQIHGGAILYMIVINRRRP